MPIERSAGAVIFRKESLTRTSSVRGVGKSFYLLLHYPSSKKAKKEYWGFPKGHIEKGETIEETAKRETREETGLTDINFLNGFREEEKYFFVKNRRKIFKIVVFLLAETKTKEIKLSFEHIGFQWLPYKEALDKLTFKNAKEILKKAHNYLINIRD